MQSRVLGIPQARLPFKVDVSVTPEGTGGHYQRKQKEREPLEFWSLLWKGQVHGISP